MMKNFALLCCNSVKTYFRIVLVEISSYKVKMDNESGKTPRIAKIAILGLLESTESTFYLALQVQLWQKLHKTSLCIEKSWMCSHKVCPERKQK